MFIHAGFFSCSPTPRDMIQHSQGEREAEKLQTQSPLKEKSLSLTKIEFSPSTMVQHDLYCKDFLMPLHQQIDSPSCYDNV